MKFLGGDLARTASTNQLAMTFIGIARIQKKVMSLAFREVFASTANSAMALDAAGGGIGSKNIFSRSRRDVGRSCVAPSVGLREIFEMLHKNSEMPAVLHSITFRRYRRAQYF